jgi:hypothetical protein
MMRKLNKTVHIATSNEALLPIALNLNETLEIRGTPSMT